MADRAGFLLLSFPVTPANRTVKGHAPVEGHRLRNTDGILLTELEQHSAAIRLKPGESTQDFQYGSFHSLPRSRYLAGSEPFSERVFSKERIDAHAVSIEGSCWYEMLGHAPL